MKPIKALTILALAAVIGSCNEVQPVAQRWSEEKANEWYAAMEWPVGCDYVPAYAGNQIQMWQPSTFDPAEIDKELGWAEDLGSTASGSSFMTRSGALTGKRFSRTLKNFSKSLTVTASAAL